MKKILIIQFRKEKKILKQEQEIIKKLFKKCSLEIYFLNYLKVRSINIKQYDFIIVGGSSFSVTKENQSINDLYILIRKIIKNNIPLLGICFGFQTITVALGGKVIKDLEKKEYGTHKVTLTNKGKEDRIFSGLSKKFFVQQGHEDFVTNLPKKAVLLAVNDLDLIEAARFNSSTYGVQFHPEMNKSDMEKRG